MRKLLSLLAAVLLCSMLAVAQEKTVSGTVSDESGRPVPFATVLLKGQKSGVTADAEGKFIIKAKEGSVLVISGQGLTSREATVGAGNIVAISLAKASSSTLDEVVVTGAFGVKKAQRTAAFSNQVIGSENLNIVRQTNINNALAGKVAGVQTRGQSSAKLNSEPFLRIRGGLGLGDRAPVYVVDGTIVGSFDINPDDVEDVTVLKGANATALFGSQATGGVIVINTKKKVSRQGIGLEINSGVTVDKIYVLPSYQNSYAGGTLADLQQFKWVAGMPTDWQALDGKFYHDYTDDQSWGPRIAGQEYIPWYAWYPGHSRSFQTAKLTPQPDNARDFWETGITTTNNLSFGKNAQGYNFKASYTNQYIKGVVPNTSSMRNTFFVTGSIDLNNHFIFDANINYSSNEIKGEFNDAYASVQGVNSTNASSGSFNQWFHRDVDMNIVKELRDARSPYGTLATWNLRFNPPGFNPDNPANFYKANYWYNPYSYYGNVDNIQERNRFFGNASLTYKLNNNFRIRGTVRKNQLTTYYENIKRSILENSALQTGILSEYATGSTNLQQNNYELIGFYNQTFGDFGVSVTAGGNIFTYNYHDVTAVTNQGLNVPDLYAITNSKADPGIGNVRDEAQVNSIFGSADLEFKKLASVTFAVREDWGSTLTPSKPNLVYPSAGASFVFSELIGTKPGWFSFGKVFGSWGKKPEALGIYQSNFTYGVNQFLWGSNFLIGTPNRYPNPELQGSLITTIEAGIDLRFIKNRLGLNVVYFDEVADKIPVDIALSGVSGFTSTSINAAKVERRGIEIVLNGKPIASKNLTWDLSTTFGYLIANPVTELVEGQDQILLEGGSFGTRFARAYQLKGEDWGQLIGGGIKRNDAGQPIVDPVTGLYLADVTKKWGSIVPSVTGGFISNLSYKGFDLGFSLDYQVGGKFFSLSEQWGHYSGLFDRTAGLNDKGKNVRDEIADGGGVHVVGVSSVDEKTVVDTYVPALAYYQSFFNNQIAEPYIHDLSFVKLREVSLGYHIPVKKIGNISRYVQGAHFSIIARNPWLIWADSEHFDPSEVVNTYGEDGQFPGVRGLGVNLKLNF